MATETSNPTRRARVVARRGLLALQTADGRVPRILILPPGVPRSRARARLVGEARALGYVVEEGTDWRRPAGWGVASLAGAVAVAALTLALVIRPVSPAAARPTPTPAPRVAPAGVPSPAPRPVAPGLVVRLPPAPVPAALELVPPVVIAPSPGLDSPADDRQFIPFPARRSGRLSPTPASTALPAQAPDAPTAAPPTAAPPNGASPGSAIPVAAGASRAGQLVGNRGGAFAYYLIADPGVGGGGTVALTFDPSDPATSPAIGVDLWQGGRLLGAMTGSGATPGQNSLNFTSTGAGPLLVQVVNYAPGTSVAYRIGVAALQPAPPSPSPTPGPSVVDPGSTADSALPLARPADGLLPGNRAGSFVYYAYPAPGPTDPQALTLAFSPGGSDVGCGLFLTVYQDGKVLASGSAAAGESPGLHTTRFNAPGSGAVVVQLANYNPAATIQYTLRRA